MKRFLSTVFLCLTMVAVTATPAVAAPAQAHVGGCTNWSGQGYSLGICIDDRATTTMSYPDIYVTASAGTANCSLSLKVWNANGGQFSNKAVPCAVGHYNGYATGPFWSSTSVHSHADLVVNGKAVPTPDSPSITLSSHGKSLYDYDFFVKSARIGPISGHAADAFAELHHCFNCSFPVGNAPAAYPAENQLIPLQACPFFTICNAPVRFFGDEPRGDFMLVAQPGHFDSPGSTVRFHFSTDASGYLHLSVRAWVLGSQLADPVNQSGAWEAWASFASNLTVSLYQRCGGIRCS
jgi:hypothetical protein